MMLRLPAGKAPRGLSEQLVRLRKWTMDKAQKIKGKMFKDLHSAEVAEPR